MRNTEKLSLAEMSAFVRARQQIEFDGQSRPEIYARGQQTLVAQEYFRQRTKQRGVIRAYMSKVTGLSLPQITRLIRQYRHTGRIVARSGRGHRFSRNCTDADIAPLAEVDKAHRRLSGSATIKRPNPPGSPSPNGGAPIRKAGRAVCGGTPSIKGTGTAPNGSITATPWTR